MLGIARRTYLNTSSGVGLSPKVSTAWKISGQFCSESIRSQEYRERMISFICYICRI